MTTMQCVSCKKSLSADEAAATTFALDSFIATFGAMDGVAEAMTDVEDVATVHVIADEGEVDAEGNLLYCAQCTVKMLDAGFSALAGTWLPKEA